MAECWVFDKMQPDLFNWFPVVSDETAGAASPQFPSRGNTDCSALKKLDE